MLQISIAMHIASKSGGYLRSMFPDSTLILSCSRYAMLLLVLSHAIVFRELYPGCPGLQT